MDKMHAMQMMAALSQPTRWETMRLLIRELPGGMPAGDIADAVRAAPNTMSAHLATLSRAGLVSAEKVGRTIIYRADRDKLEAMATFIGGSAWV